jgi:predicted MPP superfamily phosphohydrolase
MTVQYCSDLHLEFRENENFLKRNPLKAVGNILLLAGDIVPFATQKKHDWFFDLISDQFEMVYWIPGNHEYYGYNLAKKCGTFHEEIRKNVFLINNAVATYQDLRLIFSTLWTEIGPANEEEIRLAMSDFHTIRYEGGRFRPTHYNLLHQESREFLSGALKQTHPGKTLVITHHVPTFLNYPEKYRGDALNEAFAVELFDLIEPSGVDYWIYGHHHQYIPEFEIGRTRLVTNQLGYVKYGEHRAFKKDQKIEF